MAFFKGKHPDELENYTIEIGKGMYDFFTGKFKGLNQVEDASNAFGMDMKQVKEEEAKREEHYRKISEEAGRDIRFPKPKKKIKGKTLTFESEAGKRIMANKEFLSTPLGKKFVETMEKNDKK